MLLKQYSNHLHQAQCFLLYVNVFCFYFSFLVSYQHQLLNLHQLHHLQQSHLLDNCLNHNHLLLHHHHFHFQHFNHFELQHFHHNYLHYYKILLNFRPNHYLNCVIFYSLLLVLGRLFFFLSCISLKRIFV